MADYTKAEDNITNIGQQFQSTAMDQFHNIISFWQPLFRSQSIWQKAIGEGCEAMAKTMRDETSKALNQKQNQ
jgi:hypothetical protein